MSTPNAGQLKFALAIHGARLGAGVVDHPELAPPVDLGGAADAEREVELVLSEDVAASVAVDERAAHSPFELRAEGDKFVVADGAHLTEVRIVPPPRFYAERTRAGVPMAHVGRAYGAALAINPAPACAPSAPGVPCPFCAAASAHAAPLAVADVVDTVRAAFAEGAVEFVSLHVGDLAGDDAGVQFVEPYVRAIKRHFDTLVAVQSAPPQTDAWIDHAYAMGVDALSYHVELHDPARFERHYPQRSARGGRDRIYDALAHAATIFPSGTVWSALHVGLEPPESTMAGIDALAGRGVLPVLSLARPRGWRDHPLPDPEAVAPLFAHLFHAVRKARINMHWVRDLHGAVTPIEARFYVDEEARAGAGLGQFYRSRLGGLAARNLARLRRRLRVRQVSDSFDSSHL